MVARYDRLLFLAGAIFFLYRMKDVAANVTLFTIGHSVTPLLGLGLFIGFVLIRYANIYGDKPWFTAETPLRTAMRFLALTKYPPSLLFLMPTVGMGCLLLALVERFEGSGVMPKLALLGGAPMFFYILHLYMLKPIYNVALLLYGPTLRAWCLASTGCQPYGSASRCSSCRSISRPAGSPDSGSAERIFGGSNICKPDGRDARIAGVTSGDILMP